LNSNAISVAASLFWSLLRTREPIVQLDSIAMAFAVVFMFAVLLAALAWGVHQSG
jgi:hypothetical protein